MIKVGLIGCGFMGEMHASCYKLIEDVEIVAVADVRPERAKKVAENTKAKLYADGKDLIANEKLDIIDICLPTFLHTKYALMAMEKTHYVMLEKPLAKTVEEGKQLLAKQKETGCQLQIGQSMRFSPLYGAIKEVVDKHYDEIVSVDMYRISPRPNWGWKDWLLDFDCSGGAAQDLHVHDVDYALYVFGKPEKILPVKNVIGEKNSYINTNLVYKNFTVNIEGTWNMPETYGFQEGFRVQFLNSALEYKDGKIMYYDNKEAKEIEIPKLELGKVEGGNVSDLGEYYVELTHLVSLVKENKDVDKARLIDGFETLEFLLDEIK